MYQWMGHSSQDKPEEDSSTGPGRRVRLLNMEFQGLETQYEVYKMGEGLKVATTLLPTYCPPGVKEMAEREFKQGLSKHGLNITPEILATL